MCVITIIVHCMWEAGVGGCTRIQESGGLSAKERMTAKYLAGGVRKSVFASCARAPSQSLPKPDRATVWVNRVWRMNPPKFKFQSLERAQMVYSLHNRDSQQLETEISLTRSRPALNSPLSLQPSLSSRIFFQVFFSRSHLDLLYCTIPNNPILNDWGERPLIQHHTILNTIVPLTIVNKKTEDSGQILVVAALLKIDVNSFK